MECLCTHSLFKNVSRKIKKDKIMSPVNHDCCQNVFVSYIIQ